MPESMTWSVSKLLRRARGGGDAPGGVLESYSIHRAGTSTIATPGRFVIEHVRSLNADKMKSKMLGLVASVVTTLLHPAFPITQDATESTPLPAHAVLRLGRISLTQNDTITSLQFFPDGKWLASGSMDGAVAIWDVKTRGLVRRLVAGKDKIYGMSVSPNGRFIVTGTISGVVTVWDVPTSQQISVPPTGQLADLWCVVFTNDSKLVIYGDGRTIRIWDFQGQKEVRAIESPDGDILSLCLTPDGSRLVAGTLRGVLSVWELSTGKKLLTIQAEGSVRSLSLSPDGKTIASGHLPGVLNLWDAATGKRLREIQDQESMVYCVSFSPNGKSLATAGKGGLNTWNPANGSSQWKNNYTFTFWSVAYSPDGTTVAGGMRGGKIFLFDSTNGTSLIAEEVGPGTYFGVSSDGKRIATGGIDGERRRCFVNVWDRATGKRVSDHLPDFWNIRDLLFLDDKQLLCIQVSADLISCGNVFTGRGVSDLKRQKGFLESIAWTSDGKYLAGGGDNEDKTIRVWNISTGEVLATLQGHDGRISALAFSSDGKTLFSGGWDGIMRSWDLAKRAEQYRVTPQDKPRLLVKAIRVSPDGKTLAIPAFREILICDTKTGKTLDTVDVDISIDQAFEFSQDGKHLLGADDNGNVKEWSIEKGDEVRSYKGHLGRVYKLATIPNTDQFVTSSNDGTVIVWTTK